MIQSLNTDADDLTDPKRRPKDALDGVEEEEVSLWADWHFHPSRLDQNDQRWVRAFS